MDNSIKKTKINWLNWGKEAFDKSKKENKPILLDLTAVWCHWCHVMDSTSYSDDGIAETINQCFIPIKVYIDERPDIRERYNMGGFPSTVFLDSNGNIIAGETYIPPARFRLVLEAIKERYKNKKTAVEESRIGKRERRASLGKNEISREIINKILISVEDNFDGFYGGFGIQPKFPHPDVVDFLLIQYQKTKIKKYLDMALKTLDGMRSGIYDEIDFGFFRYSVTQDWKTPHYEKMLDTNAGLLRNYAMAFDITKDDKYRQPAIGILDYVNRFLSDGEKGGFYGSQDADEEFYNLLPKERKNNKYPRVDKKIYVDWNCMMVSSYINAGIALNDDKTIKFALKTLELIENNCYSGEKGICHFLNGKPSLYGLLNDNIYFLSSLIDAYSINQDSKYMKKIKEISEFVLKNFYDKKEGGFFDRITKEEDLGTLKHREKQFLENCFSAIVFLRLYSLNKEERYRQAAQKTISFFIESYPNFGYFAAIYAVGVDMLLNN